MTRCSCVGKLFQVLSAYLVYKRDRRLPINTTGRYVITLVINHSEEVLLFVRGDSLELHKYCRLLGECCVKQNIVTSVNILLFIKHRISSPLLAASSSALLCVIIPFWNNNWIICATSVHANKERGHKTGALCFRSKIMC